MCDNDEIISYLDALIKYKNSWFKGLSKEPENNCDIDLQEFKKEMDSLKV